jgi:hypothetical protein
MVSSVDWLGLGIIISGLVALGVVFRIVSRGPMTVGLRRLYVGILAIVGVVLLWNTVVGLL